MSIIFYDHLLVLEDVKKIVNSGKGSYEEKEELWQIVDELVHHRMMTTLLDNLPTIYHGEFLEIFTRTPHDKKLIKYLSDKSQKDMKKIIKDESKKLRSEIYFLVTAI